jgi:2-amino-4-hydroxy-6-hydroxymethyldihydropteridine diphosphokinase
MNAVACLDTELDPYSLLLHLLDIERMLGRKRRGGEKNAPRKADLDLLLVDDLIIHSTPLTLPHPRLRERAFALQPLVELAPQLRIPGVGPAADLLKTMADQRIERIESPVAPAPQL